MFDCANVEMRELLPEFAAGTLDAPTCERIEEHLASCAECTSELETVRLVRLAFGRAPLVNTSAIVAALPKPVGVPRPVRAAGTRAARWVDWRIAAALTMMAIGGLSLAVTRRTHVSTERAGPQPAPPTDSVTRSQPSIIARAPDTGRAAPAGVGREAPSKAQLSFGGGVGDLDTASIQALLGALDEIDRAPVAPSAEPDHTPVLPLIGDAL